MTKRPLTTEGATPARRAEQLAIDAADFDAAVFDLDGVITQTAELHGRAWRDLFDAFFRRRSALDGSPFQAFDIEQDYRLYVDGRPRRDGVRGFLASRGIVLEEGSPGDPPDAETVTALTAAKDRLFLQHLAEVGVKVFGDAPPCVRRMRDAGLRTAIVSSSRNAAAVLTAAGLTRMFDVLIDGVEAESRRLNGKPAPDTFLYAAVKLGAKPERLVGFEDALVGVEAIRAAGYRLVVGVDRADHAGELRSHGADAVVADLGAVSAVGARQPILSERLRPAAPAGPPAAPTEDEAWRLIEDGFTLAREHEVESILAIGNGRLGSRASLAEGGPMSAPATFVAGLFDDQPGLTPRLASLPDWASLSLSIEGAPLQLDRGRILEHRRILDLKQGLLWREWRHVDEAGRISWLRGFRFASQADRRLLVQCVAFTPENYGGDIRFDTGLGDLAVTRTSRGMTAALRSQAYLAVPQGGLPREIHTPRELVAELGQTYRLERIVAVATSPDGSTAEAEALAATTDAAQAGVPELLARHRAAWRRRWRDSDIRIDGAPEAQRALRFAAYHLISAAHPEDPQVSIGARALTGDAYNGHVFWDTDIFMLPFFVLTWPEAARTLLLYRYRTLPSARAKAAQYGGRGAFYAWESADTGEDVTPEFVVRPDGVVIPLYLAAQEQHISADVAYAVWSYWRATHDERFFLDAGAEILIETARFWAGRAEPDEDGLRHIRGVVGPDEYHETVDDDAYTNGMARWNLETAATASELAAREWPEQWSRLAHKLRLADSEIDEWRVVARELYTGLDPGSGLIEQFRGYFQLEDIDLTQFEPRNAPMDVLLGPERVRRSQIIKQPDVIMLLHLLGDRFPAHVKEANFRYYDARCSHGSSLSPAIHALAAARLGDIPLAERYFRQASEIDLANNMGNAAGGVHAAALGGLWQAAVFGFAGLRLDEDGPRLDPALPPSWSELAFTVRWRGREHPLTVGSSAGEPTSREVLQ